MLFPGVEGSILTSHPRLFKCESDFCLAKSPNLNAYAERFVRSIKSECFNQIIPLGENKLRTIVRAYVAHDHLERNHQGSRQRADLPSAGKSWDRG